MAKKGKSTKPLKEQKHDEEGRVMNWDSNWDEAQCLRLYIEKGYVDGLTAAKVVEKYPQFDKFTNKALTGGLKTLRDSVAKEFASARAAGSDAIKTHTNLRAPGLFGLGTIPENASVKGGSPAGDKPKAVDIDFNDVSDAVSRLGFGDDSVFDEVTVGFKSAYQQAVEKGEKVTKTSTSRGNTEAGLPYVLDIWRDSNGRVRISLQIWCLSGDAFHTKLLVRVSTAGKDLVLAFPMNPNMERGDSAFHSFVMTQPELSKFEQNALLFIVKNHPKAIARIQSISKIKQRQQSVEGTRYNEQRIPLPRKVMHKFATELDGDAFFHGMKFVKYDDGSVHLHVELLGELKDCYMPEERKQAPITQVAKSPPLPTNLPVPMETSSVGPSVGGARVLEAEFEPDTNSPRRSSKRRSTGGEIQNVQAPPVQNVQVQAPVQNVQQQQALLQALQQQAAQQALQQRAAQAAQAAQQAHQQQAAQQAQFQPHPLMYQVDPNANNANANANAANANDPPSIASIMFSDGSSYVEEEEEDAASSGSEVSTLYEEETVASGLSAPANLNGGASAANQFGFPSSLQLAAANGQQQQAFHAQ